MGKKEVLILVFLLFASFVYSAPDAQITITPISLYETHEISFELEINNLLRTEVIDKVSIDIPSLEIINITDIQGWTINQSSNFISWYGGDIETNSIAYFWFTAKADLVNGDQIIDIPITTVGNGETTDIIQLTIINDDTAPELSNPIPEDEGFLRQGISDQEISVDAEDPETGILNGTFTYWDCSANASNVTIYSVSLECNTSCQTVADLSYYEEGETMCFEYTILNNALEPGLLQGSVGFDGTAPSVALVAPDDESIETGDVDFIFTAQDNLVTELECDLLFEGEVEDSITAENGEQTILNYNVDGLDEGNHEWRIICTDGVGLEGQSEQRGVITGEPPEINFTINYVARTIDYTIDAIITDETAVDTASVSFDNNTIFLTGDGDHYTGTLTTTLDDDLGEYTLSITTDDVWSFETTEIYTFNLINGYEISLDLEPASTEPEKQVIVSGTVALDDGGDVPEEYILLSLPDQEVNVSIDGQDFEYTFTAPNSTGTYEITASITSPEGYEFEETADLEVSAPGGSSSSSSSSSAHPHKTKSASSSGICVPSWECSDWSECKNAKQTRSCQDKWSCGKDYQKPDETKTCVEKITKEVESRTPAGVGAAPSFFKRITSNPISLILFALILATLYLTSFKKGNAGKIKWEGYFEKRR